MIDSSVINLLRRSVVPQARRLGGTFFVEYGRPFKAVAVMAWILTLAITALCINPSTKIEPGAAPFIIGLFVLLALYLHSEFFFVRITYSDASIQVYTRWGSQRRVGWADIVSVQLSKLSQNFVVKQRSGQKFTFNYFMSGYQSLLAEIQKRSELNG